jgi:hypothetical protein
MAHYAKLFCLIALTAINTHATPVNDKRVPIADTLNFPCTGHRYGDMTGKLNRIPIMYIRVLTIDAEVCKTMCFGKSQSVQTGITVLDEPH